MNTVNACPIVSAPASYPWRDPGTPPPEPTDRYSVDVMDGLPFWAEKQKIQRALAQAEAAGQQEYYDPERDAADRTAYYRNVSNEFDTADPKKLYRILGKLVTDTHVHKLDYDPTEHLYPVVDRRPNRELQSIYSGRVATVQDVIRSDALHKPLVLLDEQPEAYNCEHVVPQSFFDKKSPMRGDLHHLFTCEVACNSLRANHLYGELPGAPGNDCGRLQEDDGRFEPAGGKGAVARASLYFLLRYPGQIGDEPGEYSARDLDLLLQWHRDHPVTDYERHRNREIFLKQGNRNPLIDFPDLADRIDFTSGLGRH